MKRTLELQKELIDKLSINDFLVQNTEGKFSNKKIMFTGGFQNISRSEAKLIVENNGGKVLGTISKKLRLSSCRRFKTNKKEN